MNINPNGPAAIVKVTEGDIADVAAQIRASTEKQTDPVNIAIGTLRVPMFEALSRWVVATRPTATEMVAAVADICGLMVGQTVRACKPVPKGGWMDDSTPPPDLPPAESIEILAGMLASITYRAQQVCLRTVSTEELTDGLDAAFKRHREED